MLLESAFLSDQVLVLFVARGLVTAYEYLPNGSTVHGTCDAYEDQFG
jgi:hypothetical protein